jgi:hypothetical protein
VSILQFDCVARFTRAWIETDQQSNLNTCPNVARFTRAWIETLLSEHGYAMHLVARFTRAWIETIKNLTI